MEVGLKIQQYFIVKSGRLSCHQNNVEKVNYFTFSNATFFFIKEKCFLEYDGTKNIKILWWILFGIILISKKEETMMVITQNLRVFWVPGRSKEIQWQWEYIVVDEACIHWEHSHHHYDVATTKENVPYLWRITGLQYFFKQLGKKWILT